MKTFVLQFSDADDSHQTKPIVCEAEDEATTLLVLTQALQLRNGLTEAEATISHHDGEWWVVEATRTDR